MPDHEIHGNVDMLLLGDVYDYVHDLLDILAGTIGPNHREHFHDYQTVIDLFTVTQDTRAAWCAYYHNMLDQISMEDGIGANRCIYHLMKRIAEGKVAAFNEFDLPPRW